MAFLGLALLALPFLGLSGLINGLAITVKEQGPHVPPQYEAAYRQVAFEEQVPWALLAAWDGAENGFNLPIPSQQEIYEELVEKALQTKWEVAELLCELHPEDPLYCPPTEPTLDPEEKDQLWGMAYAKWYSNVLGHIRHHSDYILDHQSQFDRNPEVAYRTVMSTSRAAHAAELYDGFAILMELDQHDDAIVMGSVPSLPDDWLPVDGFAWPVEGTITSRYGPRLSPIDGLPRVHRGVDIGVPSGTPIRASKAGKVVTAQWDSTYGQMVIIQHGGGYRTLYAHASTLAVSAGATVEQGEIIAYAGSTGKATGPHLHLEIHYQGTPVDPLLLLGR